MNANKSGDKNKPNLADGNGNIIDQEIEKAWIQEAQRRVEEIENGSVKLIAGEKVFESIKDKYKK